MTSLLMAPRVLLVLVLVLLSTSAPGPAEARRNASVNPRTFLLSSGHVTDEPFDITDLHDDSVDLRRRSDGVDGLLRRSKGLDIASNSSGPRLRFLPGGVSNMTSPRLSPAALRFLSGGVSRVFMPVFYLLVFVLSVPVNAAAVLTFSCGPRPLKPAVIFLLNLALCDLSFALLLPLKVVYHFGGNDWRFGESLCRLLTAAFYWNASCSALLICCVALDRLLAVAFPVQSLTWRKPRTAALACTAAWALSLAGSVPLVSSQQTLFLSELNITSCHDVQPQQNADWLRGYFLFLCCFLFLLPLLVSAVSYSRVLQVLSRVPAGLAKSGGRRRRRAVAMTISVMLIFLLCFLPTNVLMAVHYLAASDGLYSAYLLSLCLGSVNCVLDPLLYAFGSSHFQRRITTALRCRKLTPRTGSSHCSSRTGFSPAHNATTSSSLSSDTALQYSKIPL